MAAAVGHTGTSPVKSHPRLGPPPSAQLSQPPNSARETPTPTSSLTSSQLSVRAHPSHETAAGTHPLPPGPRKQPAVLRCARAHSSAASQSSVCGKAPLLPPCGRTSNSSPRTRRCVSTASRPSAPPNRHRRARGGVRVRAWLRLSVCRAVVTPASLCVCAQRRGEEMHGTSLVRRVAVSYHD